MKAVQFNVMKLINKNIGATQNSFDNSPRRGDKTILARKEKDKFDSSRKSKHRSPSSNRVLSSIDDFTGIINVGLTMKSGRDDSQQSLRSP